MTRITVQGIGVVGGFGTGTGALLQALATGQSQRSSLSVPSGKEFIELSAFRGDTSLLKNFVSARSLRRMDPFSQLGLLAAHLALEDAGMASTPGGAAGHDGLGVIIASGFGATSSTYALLDSINNDGDDCTSPIHFANSLHNVCSANIAIALGATGPNLTVSQFDLSVASALQTARQWLLDGRVDRLLFGAVEELSDFIGYSWFRKRGMTRPEPMHPMRTREETAIPGEGAAFLLLSRLEESQAGYCTLDRVTTGRFPQRDDLGDPPLLVVNADGRKDTGARYAALAEGARIACYTPLYGSMPASPAFDLVAGAHMLKAGRVFPTPGETSLDFPAVVAAAGPLEATRITCLALAEEDRYGLVELGPILG
jgi:3-oxoacyl-[acyl-carrier-protein] synthase II